MSATLDQYERFTDLVRQALADSGALAASLDAATTPAERVAALRDLTSGERAVRQQQRMGKLAALMRDVEGR